MAWDSKSARQRQNSGAAASGPARHAPLPTRPQPPAPKSSHAADPFLHDFLSSSFDAAEYWNATLPPLQAAGGAAGAAAAAAAVPLADLAAQAQTTVSRLDAHTTRLAAALTQLTDDILRSGSRLAYEVELLRGETLSCAEALGDGLHDDIARFVPGGIRGGTAAAPGVEGHDQQRRASLVGPRPDVAAAAPGVPGEGAAATTPTDTAAAAPTEPPFITQLRTLSLVRARLDLVIKTFGDAMEFVFPPSELSVSSSFLSVSAPDPGAESHSTEEKGQQVLRGFRDEIAALLAGGGGDDAIRGVEDAARRIEALKALAVVWRGTAEEKGRARFVESLAKMVEDRHRELLRELGAAKGRQGGEDGPGRRRTPDASAAAAGAGGADTRGYFISQLQKIRSGL